MKNRKKHKTNIKQTNTNLYKRQCIAYTVYIHSHLYNNIYSVIIQIKHTPKHICVAIYVLVLSIYNIYLRYIFTYLYTIKYKIIYIVLHMYTHTYIYICNINATAHIQYTYTPKHKSILDILSYAYNTVHKL